MPKNKLAALFKTSPESQKAKQDLFNHRLKLLQADGDINKISATITSDRYSTLKEEYSKLVKNIKDTQSLFDLHKSQAIIAFRAGEDATTYLKACNTLNRDHTLNRGDINELIKGTITLLQKAGNITKIDTPLDSSEYKPQNNTLLYKNLVTAIKDSDLPEESKNALSFNLNESLAIMAFRAGQIDNNVLNSYLLNMRIADSSSTDKLITELEPLRVRYEEKQVANNKKQVPINQVPSSSRLYKLLQKSVEEKVNSHLANKEYTEAYNATAYLKDNSKNFEIFKLYVDTCIAAVDSSKDLKAKSDAYIKAFEESKLKISPFGIQNNPIIVKIFENLQGAFTNLKTTDALINFQCNKFATEAKILAQQYNNPQGYNNPKVKEKVSATATTSTPLTKEEQKKHRKLEELKEKKKTVDTLFVTTEAEVAAIQVDKEYKAKLESKTAEIMLELEAEKALDKSKIQAEVEVRLGAIQGQVLPTILNPLGKDSLAQASAPSLLDMPPGYDSVTPISMLYPNINNDYALAIKDKALPTTSAITTVISHVSTNVIDLVKKVTEILSLKESSAKDQIKVLCDKAIKKGFNVDETINDLKDLEILEALASGFLSLSNPEKAKEIAEVAEKICGKIFEISRDAYKTVSNSDVLKSLAKIYEDEGLYKICIESCNKSHKLKDIPSEETYQLLKGIAEKTDDTNLKIEAFRAAECHAVKSQKADVRMSVAEIYWSSGNNAKAENEFNQALRFDWNIYKRVDEKMLKFLSELPRTNHNDLVKYYYLSKQYNCNPKDPSVVNKLIEHGTNMSVYGNFTIQAACAIKAFLSFHDKNLLQTISTDLINMFSPHKQEFNALAYQGTIDQIDRYLETTLLGGIEMKIDAM